MKRVFGLLLVPALVAAAPRNPIMMSYDTVIGPATSTSAYIVAASSGTNLRNCLTEVRATVSRASVPTSITLNILDAGTTIYSVDASSGNSVSLFYNETDPLCIAPNHLLALTTETASGAGTINVDYKGYSY